MLLPFWTCVIYLTSQCECLGGKTTVLVDVNLTISIGVSLFIVIFMAFNQTSFVKSLVWVGSEAEISLFFSCILSCCRASFSKKLWLLFSGWIISISRASWFVDFCLQARSYQIAYKPCIAHLDFTNTFWIHDLNFFPRWKQGRRVVLSPSKLKLCFSDSSPAFILILLHVWHVSQLCESDYKANREVTRGHIRLDVFMFCCQTSYLVIDRAPCVGQAPQAAQAQLFWAASNI